MSYAEHNFPATLHYWFQGYKYPNSITMAKLYSANCHPNIHLHCVASPSNTKGGTGSEHQTPTLCELLGGNRRWTFRIPPPPGNCRSWITGGQPSNCFIPITRARAPGEGAGSELCLASNNSVSDSLIQHHHRNTSPIAQRHFSEGCIIRVVCKGPLRGRFRTARAQRQLLR